MRPLRRIGVASPLGEEVLSFRRVLRDHRLATVCDSARCPNRPDCFPRKAAAFMILGTVCTAFTYMLWTEGVGFIPVQHVHILGYLEPLAAPLYAFVLVGEVPTVWTVVGGLLIVAAGTLVVLGGQRQAAAQAG